MTERYRRRDFGNLDLDVTLSDPGAYSKPWTVSVRAELAPDTELIEWVCNEGSSRLDHWVGKASDETKSAVKVAPRRVLSKSTSAPTRNSRSSGGSCRESSRSQIVSGGTLFANMDHGRARCR